MAPGRNDPCPCGSGKKYKKCCMPARRHTPSTPKPTAAPRRLDRARAHSERGNALRKRGHLEEAEAEYRKALARRPDAAQALVNLAGVLQATNRHAEAIGCLKRATRADPDLLSSYLNLAVLYRHLGRSDEVEAPLREVLRRDPAHARALRLLAAQLKASLPQADRATMQSLLEKGDDLTPRDRHNLHAALLAVYDARGEYEEAARHARQANALDKRLRFPEGSHPEPDTARAVDRLMATYTPEYFERTREFGIDTQRPVFIVGLPRSGTTLTERILASHPAVFGAGELLLIKGAFLALPEVLGIEAKPVDCLEHVSRPVVRSLAQAYLRGLEELDADALRVTDKTPENYHMLGLIVTMFPRAKIIHMRRDVRDIALSCWINQFRDLWWTCDERWIAAQVSQYRRIMDHWRRVLPSPMLEVDYERVATEFESQARRLVAWIELPWDATCLEFHRSQGAVRTASVDQVRRPIHTRSIGRWRHYKDDLADLYALLEPAPTVTE